MKKSFAQVVGPSKQYLIRFRVGQLARLDEQDDRIIGEKSHQDEAEQAEDEPALLKSVGHTYRR